MEERTWTWLLALVWVVETLLEVFITSFSRVSTEWSYKYETSMERLLVATKAC